MFRKVLIANRGAIACRIIRTLRWMGVGSVAVYSDADRHSPHVRQADEAVRLGPAPAAQSYLSVEAVLEAARATDAEAIHPGYGFLSERPEFAEACAEAGVVFIGPTGTQMRAFALKHAARSMAAGLGLPLLPGSGLLTDLADARAEAARIGYPVMLKSTAGGGGIGIRLCRSDAELAEAFGAVRRQGAAAFGDDGVFVERFIERARHLEVQIFGDGVGGVLALGERDCSAQRRNQKVIEETPAPGVSRETRARLSEAAVRIGQAVDYQSAGTVEFVYDEDAGDFFFLEVNTRLQVEHGVTEEVTNIDLVEWMVRQASGDLPPLSQMRIESRGHSFEARLYAEDAGRGFQPSAGRLTHVAFPPDARVESWVEPGTEVTPYYDPMLAKLIVRGPNRSAALAALQSALAETRLGGIETNLDYLRRVCDSPEMAQGAVTTSFLGRFPYTRAAIEVVSGGTQTTVQDWPGRLGYWDVGVPPSGPMDPLALRLANRLVGNPEGAAALEITLAGPELRFGRAATVALTGAAMAPTLDGVPVSCWEPVSLPAGATLRLGAASGPGMRAYLAVGGGLAVGDYLGSSATFMLGGFGGHDGRALRAGDVVHLGVPEALSLDPPEVGPLPPQVTPQYGNAWRIGVLYGPHGAPDFFRDEDIGMLFGTDWRVHHQSDRTGVRLLGPKPQWARLDGGEAGLHPSNIHDNAYAVGTVDFTGDMPILLGPDGPSLGGFVCPATIAHAELWKMGQLRPGDTVRFHAVTHEQAAEMARALDESVATLNAPLPRLPDGDGLPTEPAILSTRPETVAAPAVVTRVDGDRWLLVEFGPNVLDLALRLRVHALQSQLRSLALPGILDVTPGIRSLQIHYDPRRLPREALLLALQTAERAIPAGLDMTVPSRILRLPLSWDDPQTRLAAEKYMQSVRPDAPWCPDNIEFIRRINGLGSRDDVYRTVFDADFLVLGLGDVYLGAPVATPVDPRHRLVTTKYNPARTWTPENAVGIGGAYLCIYGMEGPGGYQLFGRTTQVWNTFGSAPPFEPGTPWLLRPFDRIRFYPVGAAELLELRDGFPHDDVSLEIAPGEFRYSEHLDFLRSIEGEARESRARQREAFEAERARWAAAGLLLADTAPDDAGIPPASDAVPEGCEAVTTPMTSSVWKILVEPGQRVAAGEILLVLEAMKVEWAVAAPHAGVVTEVRAKPGALTLAGQSLVILRTEGEVP